MNVPHSPRFEELLPAFALGALDGAELREMQEHLAAGCAICEDELSQLAILLEGLDGSAEPVAPAEMQQAQAGTADAPGTEDGEGLSVGADLRRQILAQVAASPRPNPSQPPASPPPAPLVFVPRHADAAGRSWLAAVAAVAALLIVGVWSVSHQAALNKEIDRLRGERSQLAARDAALQHRLQQIQADSERLVRSLSVVGAPGVQQVSLSAMGGYASATGRTFVDASNRKAVFYAYRLPPPKPGKTYELWFIDEDDHKTAAGTFGVDQQGRATVLVDRTIASDRISAWVVTLEPQGGVAQPTGPIVLAG